MAGVAFEYFWQDEGSCEAPPCPAGAFGGDRGADVVGRLERLGRVGAEDLQRQGIAGRVEPLAAAINMPPAFEMHAPGVFLGEKIAVEIVVGGAGAVAGEMRLTALVEFGFLGGDAAAGAGEDQHVRVFRFKLLIKKYPKEPWSAPKTTIINSRIVISDSKFLDSSTRLIALWRSF